MGGQVVIVTMCGLMAAFNPAGPIVWFTWVSISYIGYLECTATVEAAENLLPFLVSLSSRARARTASDKNQISAATKANCKNWEPSAGFRPKRRRHFSTYEKCPNNADGCAVCEERSTTAIIVRPAYALLALPSKEAFNLRAAFLGALAGAFLALCLYKLVFGLSNLLFLRPVLLLVFLWQNKYVKRGVAACSRPLEETLLAAATVGLKPPALIVWWQGLSSTKQVAYTLTPVCIGLLQQSSSIFSAETTEMMEMIQKTTLSELALMFTITLVDQACITSGQGPGPSDKSVSITWQVLKSSIFYYIRLET